MKKLDLGQTLSILANVGVIAGIVFLGYEINQNTSALQNDSYLNILATTSESQNLLATDVEFHRLFIAGERSPSELSTEDWSRYTQFMLPRIAVWEYLYLASLDNSVSPNLWSAFDPYYREIACTTGNRRLLEEIRSFYAPLFFAYLDTEVLPGCNSR